MPPKKISLADLTGEAIEVDIFDHTYTVREVTRSVQKKLEGIDKKLIAVGKTDDSDKIVDVLVGGIAVLLAPTNGAPDAKNVLLEAWKADKLSLGQINNLFEGIQDSSVEARPT